MIDRSLLAPEQAQRRDEAARLYAKADFGRFVPWVSPGYTAPEHLGPMVRELEHALTSPTEVVISTPPRHAKTTTIIHALAWLLWKNPEVPIAYISYGAEIAQSWSYQARQIVRRAGLELDPERQNLGEWMTAEGGRFVATGIGGSLTGKGFRIVIVDDPFKDQSEAESPARRQLVWDWFNAVAYTRGEPGGTSFIVNGARWHPDDLSGRLIAQGWRSVNLRAVEGEGDQERALWPSAWSVEQLRKIEAQIGPYKFGALYQGAPRNKGANVFGPPTYYEKLPEGWERRARYSLGGDFAYTANTWSDFNVIVVLADFGERITEGPLKGESILYVVDVQRERMDVSTFRTRAAPTQAKYPGPAHAFVSGVERGVIDLLKAPGGPRLNFTALAASTDKFVRAQAAAAAWNGARIRVPKHAPWLAAFLDELGSFTGVKDPHDDQVDALAGAFHPYAIYSVPRDARNLPPG